MPQFDKKFEEKLRKQAEKMQKEEAAQWKELMNKLLEMNKLIEKRGNPFSNWKEFMEKYLDDEKDEQEPQQPESNGED